MTDSEADVAHSISARPSELEGRQFDPRQSIDVCFDFPLFRVAVALNKALTLTEEGGLEVRTKGHKFISL